MSSRIRLSASLAALALLASCREAKVEHYRVPKEVPAAATAATPDDTMASATVPTGSEVFTWTAPAAWTPKAPSPMRKGSYAVPGSAGEADFSITAFPGDTGGLLANVNRWRGQVALPAIGGAELEASLQHLDANGLHFDVVDFLGNAGGAPTRVIGAIVSRPGETWFFKLTGPDATVAAAKGDFLAFLQTVKTR